MHLTSNCLNVHLEIKTCMLYPFKDEWNCLIVIIIIDQKFGHRHPLPMF